MCGKCWREPTNAAFIPHPYSQCRFSKLAQPAVLAVASVHKRLQTVTWLNRPTGTSRRTSTRSPSPTTAHGCFPREPPTLHVQRHSTRHTIAIPGWIPRRKGIQLHEQHLDNDRERGRVVGQYCRTSGQADEREIQRPQGSLDILLCGLEELNSVRICDHFWSTYTRTQSRMGNRSK